MSPDEFKMLRLAIFMTPAEIAEVLREGIDSAFSEEIVCGWEDSDKTNVPILAENFINALDWAVSNYAQDLAMRAQETPKSPLDVTLYDNQISFREHAEAGCYLLHFRMHQAAVYRAEEILKSTKSFIRQTYYKTSAAH